MKDIANITQQDKDDLYQIYTDNLDIPDGWYKETEHYFYNIVLNFDVNLMPYCVVLALYAKGYDI
ncbi:MAG: hypothetical protein GY793_10110 [Proteobacteria bacterium]|nr:hypothetical protein [Pseudomonadota bacterium]